MPLQIPELDNRTFEQLRADVLARIPVHTPEWTQVGPSDPGVTILELFAFLTDNLLYRSNQIPRRTRLAFLSLLGVPLRPASAAAGLVALSIDRGLSAVAVDRGLEVRAGNVSFRTRTDVDVLPLESATFIKRPRPALDTASEAAYLDLYAPFLDSPSDSLVYYSSERLPDPKPGAPEVVLDVADGVGGTIDRTVWLALLAPVGSTPEDTRRAVAGRVLSLGIAPPTSGSAGVDVPADSWDAMPIDPGLTVSIPKVTSTPQIGGGTAAPAPGPGAATYVVLPPVLAETVLAAPGILQVTLPAAEELQTWQFDPEEEGTGNYPPLLEDPKLAARLVTWLRVELTPATSASGPSRTQLSWIGVNAARVLQAVPVTAEPAGVGTGAPDQVVVVAHRPVLVQVPDGATTGGPAVATQETDGSWTTWARVVDLEAYGPDDPVYLLDPEAGAIRFGNGIAGRRPPLGAAIQVSYEYGGGPDGDVPVGAINQVTTAVGPVRVTNPLPTWGGDAGQDVAAGERSVPAYLQHRDRAVTAQDYRDLTLEAPGADVRRVEVLPLFNPEAYGTDPGIDTWPGCITVLVVPRTDPASPEFPSPTATALASVAAWLEPRRLVTTELYVRGPCYVDLLVVIGVVPMPGHQLATVITTVTAAVRSYLSPLSGGPADGDEPAGGWPLGTDVRLADLEAAATRVAGVRYVDSVRMARVDVAAGTITEVERVPIRGLQLPRARVVVVGGPAPAPADVLGAGPPAADVRQIPVPVLQPEC